MNLIDVMRYGHATLLRSVEDLPPELWAEPGACGEWSIKDIIAHLASYEHMLADVAASLEGAEPTPILDRFLAQADTWNDAEVSLRSAVSPESVVEEYRAAFERAIGMVDGLPESIHRTKGVLAWYGDEYDLEDFVVYTFYGHKREHAGQIAVFRTGRDGAGI